MAVGCRIKRDFQRPPEELIRLFKDMPLANIDDSMGRTGAVDGGIVPLGKGRLLGTAFTVRVPQGDNLMFHAAMDLAKPGDVIVIDAGGGKDRAIFGELMAAYCKSRGICGIVCDGAVRDSGALAAMEGFPVYARAVTPNGPYKNGPGEIGFPVAIGGRVINPGDIVAGDEDGVIVISPSDALALARDTLAVQKKEEEIMGHILKDGIYIRTWVEEILEKIKCEII